MSKVKYQENPEIEIFPEVDKVFKRFKEKGVLKVPVQRKMYEAISRNWCIGKSAIDVGCGLGIGTNILGWEAIGAFGIDKNEETISAAKQLYEAPRIKFKVEDVLKEQSRPLATFDVVVCLEVIEHVDNYDLFFKNLKRYYDDRRKTIFFISSPNRNSPKIGDERPNNKYHVREWAAGEFYEILTRYFGAVVMYSGEKIQDFFEGETVSGETKDTPILAKCEMPK